MSVDSSDEWSPGAAEWCSGSTGEFGSLSPGSIPGSAAKEKVNASLPSTGCSIYSDSETSPGFGGRGIEQHSPSALNEHEEPEEVRERAF